MTMLEITERQVTMGTYLLMRKQTKRKNASNQSIFMVGFCGICNYKESKPQRG